MSPAVKRFLQLCRQEKKWIMIPLALAVILLLAMAAVLFFTSNSGISSALYPSH